MINCTRGKYLQITYLGKDLYQKYFKTLKTEQKENKQTKLKYVGQHNTDGEEQSWRTDATRYQDLL